MSAAIVNTLRADIAAILLVPPRRHNATPRLDLADAVVATWKTNNRVTAFFFENLPAELWPMRVAGTSRRSVRTVAGHIHNARCMWIKMLGQRHGVRVPKRVNLHTVTSEQLLPALEQSSRGVVDLLELGIDRGGRIPASGVAWVNLPVDVVHVCAYMHAHAPRDRGRCLFCAHPS